MHIAVCMRMRNIWFIVLTVVLGISPAKAGSNPDSLFQQAQNDFLLSNYSAAMASFTALATYAEENRNDTFYMAALTGIGDCHYYLRDKQTALRFYHAGRSYAKMTHDAAREAVFDYKIGLMFIELNIVDSAEYYASKAIQYFRKEHDLIQLSRTLSALADIHLNTTKNAYKARLLIEEALSTAQKTGNEEMIGFAFMKHSYLSYNQGNYKQALAYAQEAESHYRKTGKLEDVMYALQLKSHCMIKLGDTTATDIINQWFQFKDSIFQKDKAANIARLQAVYETERTTKENKILQQQAQISKLKLQARNKTIVVLVSFMIAAGLFTLWRSYANRLKKKQQELTIIEQLQKDKERIARDLHDHVGGQLSFLVHSIDGITRQPEEKREELKASILKSLRSVITALRETIWAISDKHIVVTDFMDKLKVFTANMLQYSNIKYHFSENIKDDRELSPLLGLNLYRICQEIIQNTFKHAKASNLYIHCDADKQKIRLQLKDDGTGFDPETKKEDSRGIENIQARAAEFNIQVHLNTAPNLGTSYILIV